MQAIPLDTFDMPLREPCRLEDARGFFSDTCSWWFLEPALSDRLVF
jgi:hypothetical protein